MELSQANPAIADGSKQQVSFGKFRPGHGVFNSIYLSDAMPPRRFSPDKVTLVTPR
jgi:hypothetical protein